MACDFRRAALLAPVLASAVAAAGCMSSPTYGTSKSSNAQLTSDLSNMFSMKTDRVVAPDYKPRPELVKPASTLELPEPQESVTNTGNPAWPESPEQKRARILAEIDPDQNGNAGEPLIENDLQVARAEPVGGLKTPEQIQNDQAKPMSNRESKAKREEFNRRVAEANSSPTRRKYLSEPPLDYRVPAETAPFGDVGEDEAEKQRRLKRQATKKGGWRDFIPWL